MNSKKALELTILEYEKDLEYEEENQWVKNVLKGLKEAKQDLEKLEKENQVLREKVNHFKNVKNRYRRNQKFVEKENTKLKKVIKILKRFDFDIYSGACSGFVDACIKEPLTFDLDNHEELQQYELLKEVLSNER